MSYQTPFADSIRNPAGVTTMAVDPLCAEHDPRGDKSLHGAACHAYLVAAETSCQRGDTYLDRAVLVEASTEAGTAFFYGSRTVRIAIEVGDRDPSQLPAVLELCEEPAHDAPHLLRRIRGGEQSARR
jgi:hypothetical protein